MTKQKVSEQELVEVINAALAKQWIHSDRTCRVASLRQRSLPDSNWQADQLSDGGHDLLSVDDGECDELRRQVLQDLATKYDVQWP